jgi:aldehyde dehydrogenase (NAD+)
MLDLHHLLATQREFWASGQTHDLSWRKQQIQRLQHNILQAETAILTAIGQDLGRPTLEAYFEIAVLAEIKLVLRQLHRWAAPRRVATAIEVFPAQAWVQPEPLGVVLIIGPWNYPFQLLISPLLSAIAAGNCAILKPSEYAPHTAQVIADLVTATFAPHHVAVVMGDRTIGQALLTHKFDHIFFTGGQAVGQQILTAAARHLTPVTLELGGKSPCVVDRSAKLAYAARRIIWGKFVNAGQTCIAPDYLLVDAAIAPQLIAYLRQTITEFYGTDPATSPDLGRIVNGQQFDRLCQLIDPGQVICGGQVDSEQLYIAPTLLAPVQWSDPVMTAEIFGPLLPILTYHSLQEAINQLQRQPTPLALYIFAQDRERQQQILSQTRSGGVGINDTLLQFALPTLPFGGVGPSGMGRCHGQAGFETFSQQRSVLRRSMVLDLPWRYAPYTQAKLQQLRRIVTGRW